ncbi:hypothetical protein HYW76_01925 [Candidatus Pacearchaeota archaeon]|nr:hypothetical protein [Candidatus Pacearchaeota archaeon]
MKNKGLPDWQIFENNAVDYLNKTINLKDVFFKGEGGANSTDTDIFVYHKNKKLFTIEAKKSPCQSGQIVVLLNNGKYEYSEESKGQRNSFVDKIISYLNNNMTLYFNPTTASIPIQINNKILVEWIKKHYEEHGVKFVITSTEIENFGSSFIKVFPLEELGNNFIVSAVLRRKRSGTGDMPLKYYLEVNQLLKEKIGSNFDLSREGSLDYNGKNLDKTYLGERFYICKDGEKYQVKKRSKTNNPNVMFELKYTGQHKTEGFDILKKFIIKQIEASQKSFLKRLLILV